MIYQAGTTASVGFTTVHPTTKAATDADSLPTGALFRNGAVDNAVTVTVTDVGTGAYQATATIPVGYAVGDDIEFLITATVGGVTGTVFRGKGVVDTTINSRAVAGDAMALTAGERNTLYADILATMQGVGTYLRSLFDGLSGRYTLLDNLNVGGLVASQADVTALNVSASRRIVLAVVGAMERPESGTSSFTVEVRTYAKTGAAVNATALPTIAPVGTVSGSLAANLGAVSNPSTGVYRATYTVVAGATIEEIRFDATAVLSDGTFTISALSVIADFVAATWTTSDRTTLQAAAADALAARTRVEFALPTSAPGAVSGLVIRSYLDTRTSPNTDTLTNSVLSMLDQNVGTGDWYWKSTTYQASPAAPTASAIATAVWSNDSRTLTSGGGGGGSTLRGAIKVKLNGSICDGMRWVLRVGEDFDLIAQILDDDDPFSLGGIGTVAVEVMDSSGAVIPSPVALTATVDYPLGGYIKIAGIETLTDQARRGLTVRLTLNGGTNNIHVVSIPIEVRV